jgi:hypothetical protein
MGGVRNTFGRLWWRAETLQLPGRDRPYLLIESLGEDELVQLMERPQLAAYGTLAKATGIALLGAKPVAGGRSELLRDLQKRLLRAAAILAVEHMTDDQIRELVSRHLAASVRAMEHGVGRRDAPSAIASQNVSAPTGSIENPHYGT